MSRNWKLGLVAASFAIAACDSNDTPSPVVPEPDPTFELNVVHASPDAPAVNVLLDGAVALSDVDYKGVSGQLRLVAGTATLEVRAILPDGSAVQVIPPDPDPPVSIDFAADTVYTVIAVGKVADTGPTALQAKIVTQPREPVTAGNARVVVVHGSPSAPAVDVYVTAPGADLAAETPLNEMTPLAFNDDALGPVEVPAGSYQVRITVAGNADAVAFDSGEITLNAGDDIVAIAVDNTNAGAGTVPGVGIPIPVSLLLATPGGGAELLDVQTVADVRVTHAVPDAGLVDVYANGAIVPALEDFDFTETRGPLGLPAGGYVLQVAPADSQNFVINSAGDETTLENGVFYDVLATGSLADDNLGLLAAADDRRRLATAAKLRVIHGSPSTPDVDLYIVDETVTDITDVAPFAEDIPFLFNSGYLQVAAGTYNVYITPADSKTIAIAAEGIPLDANGIYTAVARDPVMPSTELGLILFDDF